MSFNEKILSNIKYLGYLIKNYGIYTTLIRLIYVKTKKNKDIINGKNSFSSIDDKSESIDIIIPAIEKDLQTIQYVIDSCRENILHNINKIFIISPKSEKISELCKKLGCINVYEDTVLPIKKKDIDYNVNGEDRSGWIYQQLIKLNCENISKEKYILLMDSDTVWIRPRKFIHNNKFILDWSDELHKPYRAAYKKLMKNNPISPVSFVAHCMIIDREKLTELKKYMESKNGCVWYKAILNNLSKRESSSFSEYETYGNFMMEKHKDDITLEYWLNKSLTRSNIVNLEQLKADFKNDYKSISFHSYNI